MELFEELDDQGFTGDVVGPSYAVRWQIPVTRFDALYPSGGNPIAPFGSTYRSYAQSMSAGSATESAECLYMIMTQTGYFADFLETLHGTQVADTDGNGLNEFIDPWGTPIRIDFFPASPLDAFTILNLPVIRSAGVNQEFELGEDINNNDSLDFGEDLNGNGVLDYRYERGDDIVSIRITNEGVGNENGIFAQ
jgi:hypothetical protein